MRRAAPVLLLLAVSCSLALAASGSASLVELSTKPRASRGDLAAMLARLAGIDRSAGLSAAVEELKRRRILGSKFEPDGRPITRADAAVPFARALGLRGGLSGRIFGVSSRTAVQELVARGMLPSGPDTFEMTGTELLGLLDKARQFKASRGANR